MSDRGGSRTAPTTLWVVLQFLQGAIRRSCRETPRKTLGAFSLRHDGDRATDRMPLPVIVKGFRRGNSCRLATLLLPSGIIL
jgi:hypothetical protein